MIVQLIRRKVELTLELYKAKLKTAGKISKQNSHSYDGPKPDDKK